MGGYTSQEECVGALNRVADNLYREGSREDADALYQAIVLLRARSTLTDEVFNGRASGELIRRKPNLSPEMNKALDELELAHAQIKVALAEHEIKETSDMLLRYSNFMKIEIQRMEIMENILGISGPAIDMYRKEVDSSKKLSKKLSEYICSLSKNPNK